MPWILNHRREHKQPTLADCSQCKDRQTETTRARLGCGYLTPSTRYPYVAPTSEIGAISESGICPGYLISLPQVGETARLYPWWEKGSLRERLGDAPSALLCDCLDILHAESNAVSAYAMRPKE